MSKPICVIKVSMDADFGNGQRVNINMLRGELALMLNDYHVFVLPALVDYEMGNELFEFQVFYEKDFTEIQYEELKKLITESIETNV